MGLIAGGLLMSLIGGFAVGLSIFKVGERNRVLKTGTINMVLFSDAAFLLGFVILSFGYAASEIPKSADGVLGVWCLATVVSLVPLKVTVQISARPFFGWVSLNWNTIKHLIGDSLLLDFGGIGVPLLLLPLIGLSNFGIYRAASNVASPVKLLLDSIRAKFSHEVLRQLIWWPIIFSIVIGSWVLGMLAYLTLIVIETWRIPMGTLMELARYSVPIGILVTGTAINGIYYLAVRLSGSPNLLLQGRVVSLVLAVGLPFSGAFLGSTEGAIYGLAVSVLTSGVLWVLLSIRHAPRGFIHRGLG